jgi:hypothetical protein
MALSDASLTDGSYKPSEVRILTGHDGELRDVLGIIRDHLGRKKVADVVGSFDVVDVNPRGSYNEIPSPRRRLAHEQSEEHEKALLLTRPLL